jgi:hypothetical protein
MTLLLTAVPGLICGLTPGAQPPLNPPPAVPPVQPLDGSGQPPAKPWPGQGDPAVEKVRRRILAREAGGNYGAVDPKHRWFGAYQFHQSTSNAAARRMNRPDLLDVPADQWAPEDQDAAFYLIYDRGHGRSHWVVKHRHGKHVKAGRTSRRRKRA